MDTMSISEWILVDVVSGPAETNRTAVTAPNSVISAAVFHRPLGCSGVVLDASRGSWLIVAGASVE